MSRISPLQVAFIVMALLICASCRHRRNAPSYDAEDAGPGSSSQLQAGAPARPNRVCEGAAGSCGLAGSTAPERACEGAAGSCAREACQPDAGACPGGECNSAADCPPAPCMQAMCVNARCGYAAAPAGSSCGAGQVCSQSGACGDCIPGTQRCVPGSATMLETCSDGGIWQRSTCEGQACFNAQCTGECEPGSAICEANGLRRCGVEGQYAEAKACAAGSCDNGACPGECLSGETRCLDLYRMQTCGSTATWGPITAVARGTCQAETCSPGVSRCASDMISQCDSDGHWGAAVSCPQGCTARGCNACRPGSFECADGESAHTCGPDGTWQATTPCPLGCDQQRCAVCRAGEQRCLDDVRQQCNTDGAWSDLEHCSAGCHPDHCNACTPNIAVCPSPDQLELIRFCNPDGTWKDVEGCRAHAHCVGGTGDTCPCDPGYRARGQSGNPNAGDCVKL